MPNGNVLALNLCPSVLIGVIAAITIKKAALDERPMADL